jgi:hypothetical protein
MTTHRSSASRLTSYTLAVVATAVVVVAGSVWANGRQHASVAPATGIDVAALLSNAEIATLPVLIVDQPF